MTEQNFFGYSQTIFKIFWIWSDAGRKNSTLPKFLKWVSVVTMISMVVMCLTDTIEEMTDGQMSIMLQKILYLFAITTCLHKNLMVAFADDKIIAYIKRLEWMSRKSKNTSNIQKGLRLYKKLFVMGLGFSNCVTSLFLLAPLTRGMNRPLPFRIIFNVKETPTWQLVYFYQIYCLTVTTIITIAYDTLFCGMMDICAGILSSMCHEIREFGGSFRNHQKSELKMKKLIDKLNEITGLISRLNDTFSMTTMTHIIYTCNTLALAVLMVSLLPSNDLGFISMTALIFLEIYQLWIYCYFGQKVVNQREIVQSELYFIGWYDYSKNFKTMVLFTIFELQKNRYIYAGKVLPLSLKTFTEVIKRAYAFFTFLNEAR